MKNPPPYPGPMPGTMGRISLEGRAQGDVLELLVATLKEGLMPLVRDGFITDEHSLERARNQAAALLGVFELKPLADED